MTIKLGILAIILAIIVGLIALYCMFKMTNITKEASPKFEDDVIEILKGKNKYNTYPDDYQKYLRAFFTYFLGVFICMFIILIIFIFGNVSN